MIYKRSIERKKRIKASSMSWKCTMGRREEIEKVTKAKSKKNAAIFVGIKE